MPDGGVSRGPAARLPLSLRLARRVRFLGLPFVVLGGLWLWRSYGMLGVPSGMDTLPSTHPPGTRCLVDKHPHTIVPGAVVFAEAGGGLVLGRVAEVTPSGQLRLEAENAASRWAYLLADPVPMGAVRGLVLVTFLPAPEVPRGR